MSVAAAAAARLRRKYGQRCSCDVESILAGEGLRLVDWAFHESVHGVIFGKWVAINNRLRCLRERRAAIAHMLGHYVLHCRGVFYDVHDGSELARKMDEQADAFAGHILIPDSEVAGCRGLAEECLVLADRFFVPVRLAELRLQQDLHRRERRARSDDGEVA